MSGHTIAITGANRGIGLELVRAFRGRGDRVIALCRRSSEPLDALGAEVVTGVEVSDPQSVAAAAAGIEVDRIDVLINVAGILTDESFEEFDDPEAVERVRRQFEVNALGPLHVTRALQDKLGKGSKVVLITSRMGSIDDNGSGGMYGYRMSKAALNIAGKSLSLDLANDQIAVGILHPGAVRTEMTGNRGNVDAPDAAAMLVERIDELNTDNSGRFLHANGEELPW